MPPNAHYDRPFHWWGPGWDRPAARDLASLLRDGTLDPRTAALLWSALMQRCSIAVIGGQAGVGKTTLLTAILPLLPHDTRHIYLRGCFEPFAFLADQSIDPGHSALLINEISPHLPVYLWGPGVSRVLHAAQRGFTLLATAHGASVQEFAASLAGSPLRIPAARIAAFDLVAIIEPSSATASGRHLSEIWRLGATRDGLTVDRVDTAIDLEHGINTDTGEKPAFASTDGQRFVEHDLSTRYRHLCSLRDGLIDQLPAEVDETHWLRQPLK